MHIAPKRCYRGMTPEASVQGSVIFIGDYWLMPDEARALRDWLNKVVP